MFVEVECFVVVGIIDLLYVVGIVLQKIVRVQCICNVGVDFKVFVDNEVFVKVFVVEVGLGGWVIFMLIEIDVDGYCSGVVFDDQEMFLYFGRILYEVGCLVGIFMYVGESYWFCNCEEVLCYVVVECNDMVWFVWFFEQNGLFCFIVSVGLMLIVLMMIEFEGVIEVCVGVYVFCDFFQVGVGVCSIDDIVLFVLMMVIGYQKVCGWMIIDVGWMVFFFDCSIVFQLVDCFFGFVCDEDGVLFGDFVVLLVNQEYGIVIVWLGLDCFVFELLVGIRLCIFFNYVCVMVVQYEVYEVFGKGGEIEECWMCFGGWQFVIEFIQNWFVMIEEGEKSWMQKKCEFCEFKMFGQQLVKFFENEFV